VNLDDRKSFANPFRPGAGHKPPYLAGRQQEQDEFARFLQQDPILQNLVLTGLRGVGKTVLLDTFRPVAIQERWGWVGTDLSEATSISEMNMAIRIVTDLSVFASGLSVTQRTHVAGFAAKQDVETPLTFNTLYARFNDTPGLIADKIKSVLEFVWSVMQGTDRRGIVFAYDEAQNLSDAADKSQFPLSLLLDVFQSIQRKGIRFMLVLTGLPTLFPKLVEARTFAERMFHVMFLNQLNRAASRDAILKPIVKSPYVFTDKSVEIIVALTSGYPYFIQFICKEVYDIWIQQVSAGKDPSVPYAELVKKLDADFFQGRWARATDRQRDLLRVAASLPSSDGEFTVQELAQNSKSVLDKAFSSSHVNQMLVSLSGVGLVYKNRYGKYSFAVPLFSQFIRRQPKEDRPVQMPMSFDFGESKT
jgi:hypothetical protein